MLLALAAGPASAETIYLDHLPRPDNGTDVVTRSGPFKVQRRERSSAARASFELLYLVTDATWTARGADGAGGDLGPHEDLSLEEVCRWSNFHGFPDRIMHIGCDVVPPPGEESTTAVLRRFSLRVGGRLFVLPDEIVVQSRTDMTGEAVLTLEPGFALNDRSSPAKDSFRISGEICAPPGTSVVLYLTSVPKEIVLDEGGPAGESVASVFGLLPPAVYRDFEILLGARSGTGGLGFGGGMAASPRRAFRSPVSIPAQTAVDHPSTRPLPTEDTEEPVTPTEPEEPAPLPEDPPTPLTPPDSPIPPDIPVKPDEPITPEEPVIPDKPIPPNPPIPRPPIVPEPGTLALLIGGAVLLLPRRHTQR